MQLDAVPPQTPQPVPDPNGKPGPHSPQPDPIPRKAVAPFPTHELAPLRWEMSEIFPGMVCRKPTVKVKSNAGRGFIHNHRPVTA